MPATDAAALLRRNVSDAEQRDRLALRFGDQRWTHGEYVAECHRFANLLLARRPSGGARGVHVGVLLDFADLGVADERHREAEQRYRGGFGRVLNGGLAGHGADGQGPVPAVDPGELVDAVEVDEVGKCVRRIASIGTRLWPPARTLASSPCSASRPTASLTDSGA